eukprot:Nk52_evm4s305 gene=Nk52_evmTU4s305
MDDILCKVGPPRVLTSSFYPFHCTASITSPHTLPNTHANYTTSASKPNTNATLSEDSTNDKVSSIEDEEEQLKAVNEHLSSANESTHREPLMPSQCLKWRIGPIDPISRLRRQVLVRADIDPITERHRILLPIERDWLRKVEHLNKWANQYWWVMNTKYAKEKQAFLDERGLDRKTVSADELGEFYTNFSNRNLKNHKEFNRRWWKKNISMIIPSILVSGAIAWRNARRVKGLVNQMLFSKSKKSPLPPGKSPL